jgi:outer membrane receptor protein involved in Fe transport
MTIHRAAAAVLALALGAASASAQDTPTGAGRQGQEPAEPPITIEEQVVVTASRSEQQLVNAPAAVTLISGETIQNSPATNVGDLLRAVPGINVVQVSARDVNLTTRGATSTLATSQLALVDGRSIYLDFFGMVMWDLVPTSPHEIRQIEVVRGPASAVWGANAMSGVVNVITRTPRELAADRGGNSLTIGFGGFDRNVPGRPGDAGGLFYVNGSHARAVDARWSYKLSAGYFAQSPLPRPAGVMPNAFRTAYPPFENEGTRQPRFDARVDYDFPDGGRLVVSGGVAGTEGLAHSGIGPFDISSGSRLGYFATRYQKGNRRVAIFTNLLDGDATNLLARGPTGQRLPLAFDTKTFDVEASDVRTIGTRHVLSFGGNYRHNAFDISIAPAGNDRNEGGAYIQDEIFFGRYFRWVVGGRIDKFSSIDDAVFSPRTTFMVKPSARQTVRFSFNRAFRAPSFINNHIDTVVLNEVDLSAISPALAQFLFPIRAVGNTSLKQETLTAYEIGYVGVLRQRASVTASVYWNHTDDGIYFTPSAFYGPANPPPGWPLPGTVLALLAARTPPVLLPSSFTYLNFGEIKDKGIELGIEASVTRHVNIFANYSYQWMPEVEDLPPGTSINDINWPARNRFNAGFDFSYRRFLGNLSVHYTDEAYWQDVLDARFAGRTQPFTMTNGTFGVRWFDGRVVTSVKTINLGNDDVQQHIFGDIVKRQVLGEVRFQF